MGLVIPRKDYHVAVESQAVTVTWDLGDDLPNPYDTDRETEAWKHTVVQWEATGQLSTAETEIQEHNCQPLAFS